jgi:TonB family protein
LPSDTKPSLFWERRILGRIPKHARVQAGAGDEGASPPSALTGGTVLISLLVHIWLILAIMWLDPHSSPFGGMGGFAVPVVAAGPITQDFTSPRGKAPDNVLSPSKPEQVQRAGAGQDRKGTIENEQLPISVFFPAFGGAAYNSRAFAVPIAAANASDTVSYQVLVGDLLERAKRYPESALRRAAKGTAKIGFAIDDSGGVARVFLLRSSGQADLDSESVALVRRAAPFPPPPAGAKHSFAIEVAFADRQ